MFFHRGFAKKTLLKTARKAGLKTKNTSKKQKYVLPNMGGNNNKYLTSPGRMSLPPNGFDLSEYPEEDNDSSKHSMAHKIVIFILRNLVDLFKAECCHLNCMVWSSINDFIIFLFITVTTLNSLLVVIIIVHFHCEH
jgi:hypothetical protein